MCKSRWKLVKHLGFSSEDAFRNGPDERAMRAWSLLERATTEEEKNTIRSYVDYQGVEALLIL